MEQNESIFNANENESSLPINIDERIDNHNGDLVTENITMSQTPNPSSPTSGITNGDSPRDSPRRALELAVVEDVLESIVQNSQGGGILLPIMIEDSCSSDPIPVPLPTTATPNPVFEFGDIPDPPLDYARGKFISTDVLPQGLRQVPSFVGSAPADISGSPAKRVQFEVGGDGDDADTMSLRLEKMTQSNPHLPNNLSPPSENNTTSTSTSVSVPPTNMNTNTASSTGGTGTTVAPPSSTKSSNRVEGRDYLLQPSATVALLPSIAEERNHGNGFPHIPHNKSISHLEHHQKLMSSTAADFSTDKSGTYGFVQLDVLSGNGDLGTREWKETARWIKYEEDLEEGSDRWGKPHIASLSFNSLIKLRQLIERDGIIMLDLEERDMPGIAYRLVEDLIGKGVIKSEESPMLMRALLLKHKHVQEFERGWFGLRRNNTSAVSLQSLYDDKGKGKIPASTDPCVLVRRNSTLQKNIYDITNSSRSLQRTASANFIKPTTNNEFINIDMSKPSAGDQYCPSEEDITQWILRKDAMRRNLPNGAESTMVMVGDIDILRKPIFVFVRLAEATFMFNVTEIPVPTRFFAILLVPSNMEMDILEIGRSFGALMSNKHFYELALLAKGRKNLLTAINEWLDDSIVLPPGDWDNHDLLPLHLLQQKSKAIRLRRLKKQLSFVKSNESFFDGTNGLVMKAPAESGSNDKDESNPFKRTGRPFGGLVNDIRRRLPYFKSDFTDALNFQCFSTIVFMYFASIGFVITFAGLMGEKTKNLIGTSETLTSTALAGGFYSLFAAQPLIPIGPTGPLLVFDEILFSFCHRYEVEFLPMRSWISVWLLLITIIVVACEGSVLVKWFTKFTQDIFAVLTALLLIFESIDNLVEIYELHPLSAPMIRRPIYIHVPLNDSLMFDSAASETTIDESDNDLTAQPNTALLSTILMISTFLISYFLKEFRNSVFLGEKARRALGDFGVPIAILTMVFLDYYENDTYTQKIKVPNGLEPSSPEERGWFINPYGVKTDFDLKYALVAVCPAVLLFILIFMSQQICELLVSSKERKLVKGCGLHFDILLIAIINCGSGFFGAPWLCCAAIRAIGHITALTVYSKNNPPGEKPTIVKVHEQRVTNLAVSLLIGCSVLLSPLLAYTPMAVLFGVFLYMGVSAMSASQLYQRFILFFIPVESHPQTPWVLRVKTWKMHLYTIIQISCLALLWGVKSWKQISLAFPFFLILLVPIRQQLRRIFTEKELDALDAPLITKNKSH